MATGRGAPSVGVSELVFRPSLVIAYPNPKMRWIFGSQNQTVRIGSTTLTLEPEFTDCFFNKVLAKNDQQRRSLDYVHTCTSSLHQSISAHTQMKLCRWGEGKHAVCASREEGCRPPRFRRSRVSTKTCRRRRLSSSSTNTSTRRSSVYLGFGERCNRDCEESGKALAVVTITIRPHRLVVRPEVCASG